VSLQYLLDTNIVSEPLKPNPKASVLRRLALHGGEIAIASLVWHELRYGMERLALSRRRSAIEKYLGDVVLPTMPVLDYDSAAAEWRRRPDRGDRSRS
jgi:tRNA(fMet)-specific endonuclease VapC